MRNYLLFSFILFACLASAQNPPSPEQKQIHELIVSSRRQLEAGNNTEAYNGLITAEIISRKLGFEEEQFVASVDLANFHLIQGKVEKSGEIFGGLRPKSSFKPETNCRYYHRLAFYYNQRGLLDSARAVSFSALAIADNHDIPGANATIYNELGNIYEKYRLWDSALYFYDLAVLEFDTTTYDYANAYYNKARTYFQFNSFDSSIYHLKSVLSRIDFTDWYSIKSPANRYIAMCYFRKGDSLNGWLYESKGREDEIAWLNYNYNSDLSKLQVGFETEQKNFEIQEQKHLVSKEKKSKRNLLFLLIGLAAVFVFVVFFVFLIRTKNKRLQKLVEENEFLMGEANHRIKNNLQIIVSLVAREISKRDDQEMDSLRSLASKIESIATLHQQMYLSDEKSEIDVGNYVHSLCENLEPICEEKKVVLNFDVQQPIVIKVAKTIYIGLLVNELVINSIKHAFAEDQNEMNIQLKLQRTQSGDIKIHYSDNGTGIMPDQKPKLVDMLCRQLKAKYSIVNNNGLNFEMTLNV